MMLYIGCIAVFLICATFVALPVVLPRREVASISRRKTINALYHDRLDEIRAEGSEQSVHRELETELGLTLLNESLGRELDVSQGEMNLWPVIIATVATPLLGLILYFVVADPKLTAIAGADEVLTMDPLEHQPNLERWRGKLLSRVEFAQDDGSTWYLLGHTYFKLKDYGKASEAFSKAHLYKGGFRDTNLYWLKSRFLTANGSLDQTGRVIAEKILSKQINAEVLEMLSLDALRLGKRDEAIALMLKASQSASTQLQRKAYKAALEQFQ